MAGEQNFPNGAKIGNTTEIADATKIAVFGDADGSGLQLIGYVEKSNFNLEYARNNGSIIEGDILVNYTNQLYTGIKTINEDFEAFIGFDDENIPTVRKGNEDYTAMYGFEDNGLNIRSEGLSNPHFRGISGNAVFNKLNDPNAFAQLGDISTGFNQATLTTPQAITALTPTVITLTGATEQENGGLDLLDISTNTITPIGLGDIITVDFAFPFETPIGSLQFGYVQIREKTTGFVVREFEKTYIKGAGINDILSGSFIIPIGSASFVTNGFEIVINSTATITLDSKYVVVTRTHKAK